MFIIQFTLLIVSIFLLWFGADWMVTAATRIARRLGVSELIVGLTVVAAGTSAPELAVSVDAALRGNADIALGNIIGSNIFNLGLILGMVVLVRSVVTSRNMVLRDGLMLIVSTVLLLLCLIDGVLTRFEGLLLFSTLAGYIYYLYRQNEPVDEELAEGNYRWTDSILFLIGLGMVIGGGKLLVDAATYIAYSFGLSEWLVGVTIVAIGTSAPEVVTSLAAILRRSYGISIGNLIGSDLFNILGVLGIAAIARPLVLETSVFVSFALMAGMAIVIVLMMRSDWRLSRTEGGFLLGMGLARWALNLLFF
ncbi:MAG: calcium/sodium antiporter [Chloroflexota bacterium]